MQGPGACWEGVHEPWLGYHGAMPTCWGLSQHLHQVCGVLHDRVGWGAQPRDMDALVLGLVQVHRPPPPPPMAWLQLKTGQKEDEGLGTEASLTWITDRPGLGLAQCFGRADELRPRLERWEGEQGATKPHGMSVECNQT